MSNFFKRKSNVTKSRYYYANNEKFEQSMDVYYRNKDQKTTSSSSILVVLVVGSGWMGHRAWVYRMTSWWNSGGPRNIADLGYTCVCVRHRGAYFAMTSWWNIWSYCALLLGILVSFIDLFLAGATVSCLLILLSFLKLTAKGSAKFDDMLNDVALAIKFIERNKERIVIGSDNKLNSNFPSTNTAPGGLSLKQPKIVFGGYSSGGHVAASLLQQPQLLRMHGIDSKSIFHGILMISAVLATEPFEELQIGLDKPRFLTDFVMTTVWGRQRDAIPSPVTGKIPNVPHLLIGNRHEVFGLPWLDIFFCAARFVAIAKAVGVPAVYREVQSDHWNILASRGLQIIIAEELPKLVAR